MAKPGDQVRLPDSQIMKLFRTTATNNSKSLVVYFWYGVAQS